MSPSPRGLAPLALTFLAFACASAASCKADKEPAKGELMLSIQTDMEIPKDVTRVELEVTSHGSRIFFDGWNVGPSGLKLPGTIAIVAGKEPATPVRIRVAALQGSSLRTLKEIVTTVPSSRIALLRVPLQWLCDDHAVKKGEGDYASTCPAGQTCQAGACVESTVDSSLLETYSPALVYGGASAPGQSGACLDTIPCFSKGYVAQFDPADCSLPAPSGGQGLNAALVNQPGSGGICGPEACLVPFDEEPTWGFHLQGGKLLLPPAACASVQSGKSLGIAVTTACPTKKPSVPTCGPWSSVDGPAGFDASAPQPGETGTGGAAGADGGPDSSTGAGGSGGEAGSAGEGGLDGSVEDAPADAPTGPFACLGNLTWPQPVLPTYTLQLWFQNAANSAPLQGLTVKVCPRLDGTCTSPTDTQLTDTNGYVSLAAPSVASGIDSYFEVTGGNIPTTLVYLTFADPAVLSQPQPQFTLPILDNATLQGLASGIGVSLNANNGHVAFTARDCANQVASGVQAAAPSGAAYYSNGSSLVTSMTETSANGQGMILNVVPGASMQVGIQGSIDAGATSMGTIPVWIRQSAVTSMNVVPWQ